MKWFGSAEPQIDKDDYHNQEYIADMDLIGMMTKTDEEQEETNYD